MGKAKDICGQKFGLLTPVSLERAEPRTAGGTDFPQHDITTSTIKQ